MTPHLDKALLAFEQAVERSKPPEPGSLDAPPPGSIGVLDPTLFLTLEDVPEWAALKAALALDAQEREEIRVGCEHDGPSAVLWRLVAQCDYQRVQTWFRGEIIRGTPQHHIFNCIAAMVSSAVLQIAGGVQRHTMRPCAQEIMTKAANALEEDLAKLMDHKKADAVIRRGLKIIPGGQ